MLALGERLELIRCHPGLKEGPQRRKSSASRDTKEGCSENSVREKVFVSLHCALRSGNFLGSSNGIFWPVRGRGWELQPPNLKGGLDSVKVGVK